MNISEDQYKIFKQVLHTFYHKEPEIMNKAQNKVKNLIVISSLPSDIDIIGINKQITNNTDTIIVITPKIIFFMFFIFYIPPDFRYTL